MFGVPELQSSPVCVYPLCHCITSKVTASCDTFGVSIGFATQEGSWWSLRNQNSSFCPHFKKVNNLIPFCRPLEQTLKLWVHLDETMFLWPPLTQFLISICSVLMVSMEEVILRWHNLQVGHLQHLNTCQVYTCHLLVLCYTFYINIKLLPYSDMILVASTPIEKSLRRYTTNLPHTSKALTPCTAAETTDASFILNMFKRWKYIFWIPVFHFRRRRIDQSLTFLTAEILWSEKG